MSTSKMLDEKLVEIFRGVVSDAIAGQPDSVRDAFQQLMLSGDACRDEYVTYVVCHKAAAPVPCGLRHVLLQLAATRDPLEVPAADREPWMVNRMQFLAAEARRVLGLTRAEAREAICGAQLPTDC